MTFLSLYVSSHFRTGGHKRYLELLRNFAKAGHKVLLLYLGSSTLPRFNEITMYPIKPKKTLIPGKDKRFARALKKWLKNGSLAGEFGNSSSLENEQFRPHLIFQFGESSIRSLAVAKRFFDVPVFIALRHNWVEGNRRLRARGTRHLGHALAGAVDVFCDIRREKRVARLADRLFFQSDYERNKFCQRQNVPLSRCAVIPNSVQVSWFDSAYRGVNSSRRLERILFVGSDDPRKGLIELLSAFVELRQSSPKLRLRLAGDFSDALPGRLSAMGLDDSVEIAGIVPSAFPEFAVADLFVIPSLYDSFPNALLEALYSGIPCCGSAVAGIKVMLEKPDYLFPPGDIQAIERTIRRFMDSEFLAEAAGHSRSRVRQFDFDWTVAWLNDIESCMSWLVGLG